LLACETIEPCQHVNKNKSFSHLIELTNIDIYAFCDKFLSIATAIDKRKFIQRNISVKLPERSRVPDDLRKRVSKASSSSFFVQTPTKRVQVCKKAFINILGVGRRKVEIAAKSILLPDEKMAEKRGGARINQVKRAREEKIIEHIKSFKCRELHYGRDKTPNRAYLSSALSIKKMRELFKLQDPDCVYSTYYSIFCKKFNLSFGSSKTDVCSKCVRLKTSRSMEKDEEKKKHLIIEYAIHIQRSKRFFTELNSRNEGTITINFDLMQNQPLPKTPVGEAFYARQLWYYILAVVIHDGEGNLHNGNVHFFSWLESEYGRGANLIISCLSHFLNHVLPGVMESQPAVSTLRFFCDSCASQNKNYAMALMLMKFCAAKKLNFEWYFPERGHSYMPADRAFGLVEKRLRKIDTIVEPHQYDEVLKQVGTLHTSREFMVHTWQETSKTVLKSGEKGFKISEAKVISYAHENPDFLNVQTGYSSPTTKHKITKKKFRDLRSISLNLKLVKKSNKMSNEKIKDVKTLLTTMGIDWNDHLFYNYILKTTPNVVIPSRMHTEDPDNIAVYDEDED